jgi:small subunit ribosomal protein S4
LFLINQKKVNIPSYRIKAGDLINIRSEKSFNKGMLAENLKKIEKKESPSWLTWSAQENQAKVVNLPQGKDLTVGIDTRLIVEFYSK